MRAIFGRGPSQNIFNNIKPPIPPWGGVGTFCFKVRVYIRTCVPNLGAARRKRFLTIDNPLNPPGVGQIFKERVSIRTCVPNSGAVRREIFLTIDNPQKKTWDGVGQICF